MGRLANFLRLPSSQRRLILQVTFLLGLTQLALRLLPFRRVYGWINHASQPPAGRGEKTAVDAGVICATVNKSGHYFLGIDSCFPQALVGEMLLERNGHPAVLRIGVIKQPDGELKAHAWVERNGEVVIGGPISHVERYTLLPELDKVKL
jgi:hypothetical protein